MTPFSATDSALGYLYRVRVALLWPVRRALQGTLVEHADKDWHRDAVVESWRGGKKLVPDDWKREDEGDAP